MAPDGSPILLADLIIQALVGSATVLVALAAFHVARGTHRTEKDNFLISIRREWEDLRPDWNRALMYVMGAESYYHEASPKERTAHAKRIKKLQLRQRDTAFAKSWEWTRYERATVSRTARFLVYASDALMTGRWSIREAYALFGPDVARHYQTILWMAHRLPSSDVLFADPGGDANWKGSIDQLPEFNFYDSQDALVVFAHVLRAEQCRRGDTHPWFVSDLARDLRGAWDRPVRRALSRATRARGRWYPRISLTLSLHRARHPWKRSAYQFEHADLQNSFIDKTYFKRPYESSRGNSARIYALSKKAEF